MDRKKFLRSLAMLPLAGAAMKIEEIRAFAGAAGSGKTMPALFVGHGSPMNAIEENEFVTGWRNVAAAIPKPEAILCISAHWETRGSLVTAMDKPRTIHDFGGFPRELYQVQYPAPGSPEKAAETKNLVKKTQVGLDMEWGLDHGAWSVLRRMYPDAGIPVIQLSLDRDLSPLSHYELAHELAPLRRKGVLIIGSGNIVHNLRMVDWARLSEIGHGFDWALEASEQIRKCILSGDHRTLAAYNKMGKAVSLAIPTPEHFLPLLYILAQQEEHEPVAIFNDKAVAGSLTMTSFRIG